MTWISGILGMILAAGPQDRPAQPGPPQPPPAAKDSRQAEEEARRQYELALLRERQEVWIEKRNAAVGDIVEEFRRQTGLNIVVDYSNVPEDFRIREFVVRRVPFREAFDHFLKLAEMEIQEETPAITRIGRPIRMSINVRDSDIKEVLQIIANISGTNLIFAPERIKGKVTVKMDNVPWHEILTNVVKTLGYATVLEKHGIVRIISTDELVQQMETRVFKLRYISPPSTYRAKIEESKQIFGRPIQPPQRPEELERYFPFLDVVRATLSRTPQGNVLGNARYDFEGNAIIVTDTKPVLDKIAEIVAAMDVEPDMVMLSMKFLSTRNENLLNWGMQWFGIDQLGTAVEGIGVVSRTTPFATGVPGLLPTPGPPTTPPTQPTPYFPLGSPQTQQLIGRMPFGIGSIDPDIKPFYFLTEYDMRVLFRAFRRDRYTKLLQEPTISVMNGQEATIFVGENVPYAVARLIVVPGAPTQVFAEEGARSPVRVGFQVLVQPRILSDEDQVILTVIPQNVVLTGSSQTIPGFEEFNISGQQLILPRTGETTMVTRLKVDNNQTVVIGGLVIERVSLQDAGIPGLKDIPLINFLFSNRQESETTEHLLMFLTAKIVRRRREMAEQLDAQRRLKEAQIQRELEELRRLWKQPDEKTAVPEGERK